MEESEKSIYLLIYSGHGTIPTEPTKGGDWACVDGKITLEDVLKIWRYSNAFQNHKSTRLILICDACYSGCWVERLKNDEFKKYRVIIQSSTNPQQIAKDSKFGGAFLCYWLKKLEKEETKINLNQQTPMLGTTLGGEVIDIAHISERVKLFGTLEY